MQKTKVKDSDNLENRKKVVEMRLSGETYATIKKKTGKAKSYVQRWIARFKKNWSVFNLKRKNQPRKIFTTTQKKVLKLVRNNNRYSCRNLSKKLKKDGINISKSKVHQILQKNAFRNVKPKKKPDLTEEHKKNRLNFAKIYKTKNLSFWKRVIFSDESPFEQGGNCQKIWVEKGSQTPICPTKKFPVKIQVWGAIGWKGKSPLFLIEEGKMLNSESYQKILSSTLISNLQNLSSKNPILVQDGASCHTSKSTINFLKQNKIKTISNWPAQSPDLNVIENLWSIIKRNIDLSKASTSQQIFQIVKKEWEAVPQQQIQNLIQSMERRMQAVIDAKGENTKY
jgi:transposase